ncbi:xanthine dehydrogenase family protein molybdopterin-binding subunit [Jannaschia aquimarina]|uniref:IorB_2 protein n=1 Tax=Jannaschia aquimarina TaxID=935700 RepID=A0A0D1EL69_9RHOB|nr:molybdopterin cofactor-binding domain-containing protein [Jannaschia aquimarina]KIT16505.1 Isoquinoline 1-oxidoreductase subunit beta [Jannaschia aquimarina]SNT06959.1 isoquinoline 1-oxidoreductase, beta subunit [Jannaschia aquimarina]
MSAGKIVRRTFLVITGAVGAGIAFGAWRYLRDPGNPLTEGLAEGEAAPNAYVIVDADGVTLVAPRADVGQGAASIQAHLLAEELDVDPHAVRLTPGPASGVYWNGIVAGEGMPFAGWDDAWSSRTMRGRGADIAGKLVGLHLTGGSTTVPDMYDRLRVAGASARETLKLAAARRAGVNVGDLRTEDGTVILPDGGTIPYGDLAADLAGMEAVQDVDLRDASEWRLLGRELRRTDIVAKSTGTFTYGTDIRLPGMIHATAVTNPARGGGVARLDDVSARLLPGVEDVVPVEDGFAVLSTSDWAAIRGAREVDVTWGTPAYPATSDEMWGAHAAALDDDGTRDSRFRDDGDVVAAPGTAIEVEYRVPFLAHAPLEPSNATVIYTPERTQVWTSTQAPTFLRDAVSRMTGQPPEAVEVNALPGGGSFGRRLEDDQVRPAVEIAKTRPGTPIRMTWTREQDTACDYFRPMALARGRATHEGGRVTGLDLSIAAHSVAESQLTRQGFPPIGPDVAITAAAWDAPYAIPSFRVSGYRVPAGVGVSSWRSVGASHNGFFLESLLDEAIHAAGADPLEERLRLMDHEPSARVLEAVAEMAGWDGPRDGRGVAFCYSFGVPCAQIVEVEQTDRGLRLTGLWVAAEVGRILDPVNLEAQLSGGALFGLGHAMHSEITFADHVPEQRNFDTFLSLRQYEVPPVRVRALETTDLIRGAGEPGVPPAAPALANAIFAATGERLREMPFDRSVRFA